MNIRHTLACLACALTSAPALAAGRSGVNWHGDVDGAPVSLAAIIGVVAGFAVGFVWFPHSKIGAAICERYGDAVATIATYALTIGTAFLIAVVL